MSLDHVRVSFRRLIAAPPLTRYLRRRFPHPKHQETPDLTMPRCKDRLRGEAITPVITSCNSSFGTPAMWFLELAPQRHFDDGTVTPARIGVTWA